MSALSIRNMNHTVGTRELEAAQTSQSTNPKEAAREHLKTALFIRRMSTNRGEKAFWTQSALRRLAEYRALTAPAADAEPCSMADFPTLGDDVDADERDRAAETSHARRGW